ncbi:MAG: 30S ribosome-binding factor RbfA [bacterium]|nr:30S ribosome-binding factor RbfA [bacterium]MCP4967654.1 30S ribosome-binding factor RbfA [bacterium]
MSKPKSPRMRKVNELLREVIAEEATELKDPRIGFLTITGVDTAPNLRNARVYYSVIGDEEQHAETAAALKSAAKRFQAVIGSQTRLKYTPVLQFIVDPAIDEGIRMDALLQDLKEKEESS